MTIGTITLDCASMQEPDAGTIDRIARFQVAVRRNGGDLRLENASRSLLELIDLCGLAGVLRVEPGRQAEQRKQPRGVEEEGDAGDPTA